jgi:bifunctional UDP-N-acetylglucosamine pyrophosphorylase/glucosamine-1-phosphate N-acetyltransferase
MFKKVIINSQKKLIDYFQDASLRMKKNSVITFQNNLKLGSNILFEGKINLGKNNTIGQNCLLNNVNIGNNNIIKMSSLIENSRMNNQNIIGPFAFIRDKTKIKNNCIIGAYAEVTRSYIKNKCQASHRVFIGDAIINEGSIIGAGTVFCNYNFTTYSKSITQIGKNCKIGSNVTIIAPIKIRSNALIPASTKYSGK